MATRAGRAAIRDASCAQERRHERRTCEKGSYVGGVLAEFSRARRSSAGDGLTPWARNAERTHAATPHALGDAMEVP
eukprot:scaffold114214_cov30-Tisochrysis_lutea.AAC.12